MRRRQQHDGGQPGECRPFWNYRARWLLFYFVLDELTVDGVPATLITDSDGALLHVQWGPPTLSTLRELLWKMGPDD